jgi:hypothetical protein
VDNDGGVAKEAKSDEVGLMQELIDKMNPRQIHHPDGVTEEDFAHRIHCKVV